MDLCYELNIPTTQYFEKICSLKYNQLKGSLVLQDYIKYFLYANNKNMFAVSRLYALTLVSFRDDYNNTLVEGNIVEINSNWTVDDLTSFEKPSNTGIGTGVPYITKFKIYPESGKKPIRTLICNYIF